MNKIIVTSLLVLFYGTSQVVMAAPPSDGTPRWETPGRAPVITVTGVYAGISALEIMALSRRIAAEAFVGYKFTRNFAYEAGIIAPVSSGQSNYLPAWNLSILGMYPINRYVNLTGRLGSTLDGDQAKAYLGLGGTARLTNRLDVRLEARTDGIMPSAAVTAGLAYNF